MILNCKISHVGLGERKQYLTQVASFIFSSVYNAAAHKNFTKIQK